MGVVQTRVNRIMRLKTFDFKHNQRHQICSMCYPPRKTIKLFTSELLAIFLYDPLFYGN